jgi:multiple sugar transport system permease protein
MAKRYKLENAVLASPTTFFLLVILGFPVILSLVYGFSETSFETLRSPEFSGLNNFHKVTTDGTFWQAVWFSFRFGSITAILECALGLALAVYLAPLTQKNGWIVAVLIIPMIVAPAMMGLMYRLVLNEFAGPIPYYLYNWLGWSPAFLSPQNVFTTVVLEETQEMREAATVDGTRPWRLFWKLELPLMMPTVFIAAFIRFIDGFRVFDNIYTLVGAGPGGSTTSMSIYIYETFLRRGEIGKSMAAAILLFAAAFILLSFAQRLMRRTFR